MSRARRIIGWTLGVMFVAVFVAGCEPADRLAAMIRDLGARLDAIELIVQPEV